MAWGGKIKTRMGDKQRKFFLRNTHRRLPPPPNPYALVPIGIMRQLAAARLPPDKKAYEVKLRELMRAIENNGKGKSNGREG
jgi:hypothetical protein